MNLCFPAGSDSKEFSCNVGDLDSIPGLGLSPGGEHGNSLQFSCLENPHEQRSMAGYSPEGCKESDMTKYLSRAHMNLKMLSQYLYKLMTYFLVFSKKNY